MADANELSFKVAQAKSWKESVMNELGLVEQLLEQVATEVQTAPYEDDTIMCGIKAAGDALAESYKLLDQQFKTAVENIDQIVKTWQDMISKLLEGLKETVQKIGQKRE